jgi:hypothetical protein
MDMKRILQALDGASTKPVEGANDIKKFVSIVTEGANPHKVSLPVQMAMQHYREPAEQPAPKQPSLLKKYFAEAEAAVEEQKEIKRLETNQYAQKIANRVLMKEARLDPNQMSKLFALRSKMAADKPKPAPAPAPQELTPQQQAEVDDFEKGVAAQVANWSSKERPENRERKFHLPQRQEPAAEPEVAPEPEVNADMFKGMSVRQLQQLKGKMDTLIKLSEKIEQLVPRAEKYTGDLPREIKAALEVDYGVPKSIEEYDYLIQKRQEHLASLVKYIEFKRALYRKPKTPRYEDINENADQPIRDERTIQQEIKVLTKTLQKVEYAYAKAREITREIKHDDVPSSIITRIRALAASDIGIDDTDLKYAEQDVFNAIKALESAVYGLDVVFNDAVRHAQNRVDELEGEISDMQWEKKYGRPGV